MVIAHIPRSPIFNEDDLPETVQWLVNPVGKTVEKVAEAAFGEDGKKVAKIITITHPIIS